MALIVSLTATGGTIIVPAGAQLDAIDADTSGLREAPPFAAADCACGEVWRVALQRERSAWDVERARFTSGLSSLESELALLRRKLSPDGLGHDGMGRTEIAAQSSIPHATGLGEQHTSEPLGGTPALPQLPSRTLQQADSDSGPQCSLTELIAAQADPIGQARVEPIQKTIF